MLKFRVFDKFNHCFMYSDQFSSLAGFFDDFLSAKNGGNNPILEQWSTFHDTENKEIFAGDIVTNGSLNFLIVFNRGCFCAQNEAGNIYTLFDFFGPHWRGNASISCRKIGDVHFNRELFKGKYER